MTRILTVTVNPAIDLAASVDHVVAGPKLRCGPARTDPGGGGINVARAITKLGGQATALFATGGATGEYLTSLIKAEGVAVLPVPVKGETRQNIAVTDASTAEQYRFSLLNHTVDAEDEARLMDAILAASTPDSLVVLSGGLPPGMSVDFHAQAQNRLAGRCAGVVVDTCDPALPHLLAHPAETPFHVLRVDMHEADQAAGRPLVSIPDSLDFASSLIGKGIADIMIIGRGAEGSVMATQSGLFFCHAPKVEVRSKIGAGDSFVGAFTLGLSRGEAPEKALQIGVAAASATVTTEGTALCNRETVETLMPLCTLDVF